MNMYARIIGATGIALLTLGSVAMAQDANRAGGIGGTAGSTAGSARPATGGGNYGALVNRGGGGGANVGNSGGGGNRGDGIRNGGGRDGPRLGNNGGQPRFNNNGGNRGNYDGNRNRGRNYGNYGGNRRHRGGNFYVYGGPSYGYYDGYSDGYGSCRVYWNRYQATGLRKWKLRYYDCIS